MFNIPALIILCAFAGLMLFLEVIRRRALEEIRVRHHDMFLAYYAQKIAELCGNDEACKEHLMNYVLRKLADNIVKNKISYANIYEEYEKYMADKQINQPPK